MDYASRAAKNSPLGCFCAVFGDSAAAVLIHPLMFLEKFRVKQKLQYPVRILEFLVGAGGFEQVLFRLSHAHAIQKLRIQAGFQHFKILCKSFDICF